MFELRAELTALEKQLHEKTEENLKTQKETETLKNLLQKSEKVGKNLTEKNKNLEESLKEIQRTSVSATSQQMFYEQINTLKTKVKKFFFFKC